MRWSNDVVLYVKPKALIVTLIPQKLRTRAFGLKNLYQDEAATPEVDQLVNGLQAVDFGSAAC
jgi:hypothetical protein